MAQKFPYTPTTGALAQLVQQLRRSFPAVIDSGIIKKLSLAPNNENYLVNTLRFLGVIDDGGNRVREYQDTFKIADDAEFSEKFREIVQEAYKPLFDLHGDAAWSLERAKLLTFFRQSDDTSVVVGERQVGTFLTLADLSGKASINKINTSKEKSRDAKDAAAGRKVQIKNKIKEEGARPLINTNLGDSVGAPANGAPEIGVCLKVEIILPASASAETYDLIFTSMKRNLLS